MTSFTLTLKPLFYKEKNEYYYREEKSVRINLCPYDPTKETEPVGKNLQYVYYDYIYDLCLKTEEKINLEESEIFVNDEKIEFEKQRIGSEVIIKPIKTDKKNKQNNKRARIFLDCPGYVDIFFVVSLSDGTKLKFRTEEYLVALLRKNDERNKELSAMVNYVWSNRENFLLYGQPQSRIKGGLKENGEKSLSGQLRLLEKIAVVYESSYGYFRANSRFCIKQTARIEDFERLQYVSPTTLQYIVSHPEQLRTVSQGGGIRIGNRSYQPQKTLMLQNVKSFDTYENRVILGFLRRVIDDTDTLYKKLPVTGKNSYSDKGEYIDLPGFLVMVSINEVERTKERIKFLNDKFRELWGLYSSVFSFAVEPLLYNPRPTAILLTVPQYNKVFELIQQWLCYGVYDFVGEEFLLSLMKISQLYEVFLLVKLLCFFKSHGYVYVDKDPKLFEYKSSAPWEYRNTRCQNTFTFYKSDYPSIILTLYFQPVIYKRGTEQNGKNGIGLYRDNSKYDWGDNVDSKKGNYYTPDYLLKVEGDGFSCYLIMDAKFSERKNLIDYQIQDLIFKYLFTINAEEKKGKLSGVCVLYGKNSDTNGNKDDNSNKDDMILNFNGKINTKFLKLIPLFANEKEGNFEKQMEKVLYRMENGE